LDKKNFFRLISLLLIIISCIAVVGLVFYENDLSTEYGTDNSSINYLAVPICIAIIRLVCAKLLYYIVFELEGYHHAGAKFRQYFIRNLLMRILIMYCMVFGVYALENPDYLTYFVGAENSTTSTLTSDVTASAVTGSTYSSSITPVCMQTSLGILFYRVLLYDIAIEILFVLIFPVLKVYVLNPISLMCHDCCSEEDQQGDDIELDDLEKAQQKEAQEIMANASSSKEDIARANQVVNNLEALVHSRKKAAHTESIKDEFNILDNIVDILYRQILVWSGMTVAPSLPLLAFMLGLPLFYLKFSQVKFCSAKKHTVIPVSKQHRFFRFSLIICLMLSIVPYTVFLSVDVEGDDAISCGPYANYVFNDTDIFADYSSTTATSAEPYTRTISDIILQELENDTSAVFLMIVDYMRNAMVLWMILILAGIALVANLRLSSAMRDEIKALSNKLKEEAESRNDLQGVISIDKFWEGMRQSTVDQYQAAFNALCGSNLQTLCKTHDSELQDLIDETGDDDVNGDQSKELFHQLYHFRHILAVGMTSEQMEDEKEPESV
jgi:hypothetical protein